MEPSRSSSGMYMGSKSRQDVSEVNPPRASVRARAKSGEFQVPPFIHTRTEILVEMNSARKMFLNLLRSKCLLLYCKYLDQIRIMLGRKLSAPSTIATP